VCAMGLDDSGTNLVNGSCLSSSGNGPFCIRAGGAVHVAVCGELSNADETNDCIRISKVQCYPHAVEDASQHSAL
jgi:hypothetical protein